jgi:endonuclease/exonuclease/phosphatase family metal-dependent hydrolase
MAWTRRWLAVPEAGLLRERRGERRPEPCLETERALVRLVCINTHRGKGPKLPYLLRHADAKRAERLELLHATRAYTFHIASWLERHREAYHAVALQEVLRGVLGLGDLGRFRQHDYYRALGGYPSAITHRVGFAGFRYENMLLSRLEPAEAAPIRSYLPCPVFRLAACGFTLAPYVLEGRPIWIGNTHLHAYNPVARAVQATAIARTLARLGDVPVLFMGDLNTVPPGCKDGDFPDGERDVNSYRGDETLAVLRAAGLQTVEHRDERSFHTYPTGAPNRTLDYILFSRHWEVREYRVVTEFLYSDHYPVEGAFRLVR